MNTLRIRLNDRKRFVCSAAMAAVFVLLAGGANALATTVWTVSKASSNNTCVYPSTTTCNTIGSAVSAASAGDIIMVGPGTYTEYVDITKSISLFGAQAGNDARVDRQDPSKESIVNALTGENAIYVYNANVVIDGFTVQGAGAAGNYYSGIEVTESSGSYTTRLLNNIVQNNSLGVYLYLSYYGNVVEHNLFRNNNATGSWDGVGIAIYYSWYDLINENEFTGNKTAAIYADYSMYYGTVTNNTSENDGAFVIFLYKNYGVKFCHNHGKNFGHGAFAGYAGDAAVAIGDTYNSYNNYYLDISDNDLENGEAPIVNGIAFTTFFETKGASAFYVNVTNNRIKGFPENGIVVEQLGGVGTLSGPGSYIVGNAVSDNGNDGILIEGPTTSYNSGITLFDNVAKGDHVNDCEDDTTGAGPLGTNTWWNNIGNLSSPNGLCTPGR